MKPAVILVLFSSGWISAQELQTYDGLKFKVGPLEPVPAITQRDEWSRFIVLVWQYQTDALKDVALYESVGLHGFHIDRGAGQVDRIQFSLDNTFPYYVDHAAGKGILYISDKEKGKVLRHKNLLVRPNSLANPETIADLKSRLKQNVAATSKGLVFAYAFDDEISLGSFTTPAEVDVHPASLAWYKQWLKERYQTIGNLNEKWDGKYGSFDDVRPVSFEDVREAHTRPPFSGWNLSRWSEWRAFMDYQFSSVLADLTRYTNELDPRIPAGFVGGQQPTAYGGYDYALLCRAVQWMEAYDIGANQEILRSLWAKPRRQCVQTYFTGGDTRRNTWLLWYRLAQGNQANIAWPAGWFENDAKTGKRQPTQRLQEIAGALKEIQGPVSEFICDSESILATDPIGIYYSHPSIRAGWAMDVVTHGSTWPNRSSSLDSGNLTSGRLRISWCKIFEDMGYQADFISYLDVEEKRINLNEQFKVIVLPQISCLSDKEAQALTEFVKNGGTLIADYLCGVMTETGRGRNKGALDDLFGIQRFEKWGYMNGKMITEIDGELYDKPFDQRLNAYSGAFRFGNLVVYERGTKRSKENKHPAKSAEDAEVVIENRVAEGRTWYLNLTPTAYKHVPFRVGELGQEWRGLVGGILDGAGVQAKVSVHAEGETISLIEPLLWKRGNHYCLALVQNWAYDASMTGEGKVEGQGAGEKETQILIKLKLPVKGLTNMRTGKVLGDVQEFKDSFTPWEANLYEFAVE
ncbi:MAG: beta-galactosidase trimerization domain-containing protein [Planctomycetota bacterium]|nr:beta-galactosidase trimerization domain-containing protein [Planctomycetota bacterium]